MMKKSQILTLKLCKFNQKVQAEVKLQIEVQLPQILKLNKVLMKCIF